MVETLLGLAARRGARLALVALAASGCGLYGHGTSEPTLGGRDEEAVVAAAAGGTTASDDRGSTVDAPPLPLPFGDSDAPLPPPLPVESPEAAGCAESPPPRAVVRVPPARLTECQDGFAACSGRLTIQVENCGPGSLAIESIVVTNPPPHEGTMELTFAPDTTIGVGETLERQGFVAWEGLHDVQVHVRERGGAPIDLAPVSARVTNPVLAEARAECEACRGVWGRHGLAQSEGCICGTGDEGKECRDGADCEGPCVFERFEEVAPGMGVPVGRCAGSRVLFGCNPLIRDGAGADPPQPLPGRAPTICVD
ncbi:MAG: hypothetical protein HY905_17610 [Deltaproteobacteria bacterium]|nr:hypothetical protein [Deltaproteobacteria bacterium]